MIVVAIVAILAGIAYPSYQRYVMQSHRTEAQTAMVQTAQYLEPVFINKNNIFH